MTAPTAAVLLEPGVAPPISLVVQRSPRAHRLVESVASREFTQMKLNASIKVAVASVLAAALPALSALPAAAVDRDTLGGRPTTVSDLAPTRPARTAPTRTTLTVAPTSGPAYQPVTVRVTVTPDVQVRSGAVTIRDGSTVLVGGLELDGGTVSITTNALGPGEHILTVALETAGAAGPASGPVHATYGDGHGGGGPAAGNVGLTIPAGSLTITSPYTASRPLDLGRADVDQSTSTFAVGARIDDIVVTDTRAGNQGFTASVSSSRFVGPGGDSFAASRAGFVDVAAEQVPGNALLASDVRVVDTRPSAPGLGAPRVFARYATGISLGTVHVHGTLAVVGIPSSARAGRYLATLTFTAM